MNGHPESQRGLGGFNRHPRTSRVEEMQHRNRSSKLDRKARSWSLALRSAQHPAHEKRISGLPRGTSGVLHRSSPAAPPMPSVLLAPFAPATRPRSHRSQVPEDRRPRRRVAGASRALEADEICFFKRYMDLCDAMRRSTPTRQRGSFNKHGGER